MQSKSVIFCVKNSPKVIVCRRLSHAPALEAVGKLKDVSCCLAYSDTRVNDLIRLPKNTQKTKQKPGAILVG